MAATLLLHALIVLPLFLVLSVPPSRPASQSGAGASALPSAHQPVMTVVFINESSSAERVPPPAVDLASRGHAPLDLRVVVLGPDASPAAEDSQEAQDRSTPAIAVSDQAQHALLYGRYVGQVQARIERAWMRPRTEIGAPAFSCSARITQDRRGNVVSTEINDCNGTESWQQSLLSAIRSASPLPAPPDPSVYADTLLLHFRSEGFIQGGPIEGFETGNRALVAEERNGARTFIQEFESRDKDGSKVIHLTLIGESGTGSRQPELASPLLPQALHDIATGTRSSSE
jgi:hypothetical protein